MIYNKSAPDYPDNLIFMTKNNFESEGATMTVSKIGQRRQVTIPKDLFAEMGLKEGDFIEVVPVSYTHLDVYKRQR